MLDRRDTTVGGVGRWRLGRESASEEMRGTRVENKLSVGDCAYGQSEIISTALSGENRSGTKETNKLEDAHRQTDKRVPRLPTFSSDSTDVLPYIYMSGIARVIFPRYGMRKVDQGS
jgi:hypothetical protein